MEIFFFLPLKTFFPLKLFTVFCVVGRSSQGIFLVMSESNNARTCWGISLHKYKHSWEPATTEAWDDEEEEEENFSKESAASFAGFCIAYKCLIKKYSEFLWVLH